MIKVAITGHRPDSFLVSHYEISTVIRMVDDTVWRLKKEYKEELCFNLGGALGTDLWAGSACIKNDVKFRLYLPFHPKIQAAHWTKEQRLELDNQLQKASGIDIMEPNPDIEYNIGRYFERNQKMVDDASFVVAFWVGKRRGGTFHAMNYALKNSKFVFNALDGLRPIFTEELNNGWTPPTVGDNARD
jgi:uncharacterized phage-like protein YoqJ